MKTNTFCNYRNMSNGEKRDEFVDEVTSLVEQIHLIENIQCAKITEVGAIVGEMKNKIKLNKANAIAEVHNRTISYVDAKNLYRTQIYKNGKRKDVTARTEEELYNKLYEFYFGKKAMTVEQCYWSYSHKRHAVKDATTTVKKLDQIWNDYYATNSIAKKKVADVTTYDLIDFFNGITEEFQMNLRKLKEVRTVTNHLFDQAIMLKLRPDHPSRCIVLKEFNTFEKEPEEKKCITPEWRNTVLEYLDGMTSKDVIDLAIELWLCLPLRVGEWSYLKWEDINFVNGTIYVHHSGVLVEKENGGYEKVDRNILKGHSAQSKRIIPISSRAIRVLYQLKLLNGTKEYVIQSGGKKPITTNRINKYIKRISVELDIEKMTTHCQRRGSITSLYEANIDENIIQAMAGHTDVKTTRLYDCRTKATVPLEYKIAETIFG